MIREVDINDISDGNRYHSNDMVKISCNDCNGCYKCCTDMGKSIILDPYDIYQLTIGLNVSFEELLAGDEPVIELSLVDGLLLPNIVMDNDRNSCRMLSDTGRCTIHGFRPGFCRMFPLGRIYEDGKFSYFNQIYECDYPTKSKVKIKKWLGIDNLASYEKFCISWHDYLDEVRGAIKDANDTDMASKIMVGLINRFYREGYRSDISFYDQINERLAIR